MVLEGLVRRTCLAFLFKVFLQKRELPTYIIEIFALPLFAEIGLINGVWRWEKCVIKTRCQVMNDINLG